MLVNYFCADLLKSLCLFHNKELRQYYDYTLKCHMKILSLITFFLSHKENCRIYKQCTSHAHLTLKYSAGTEHITFSFPSYKIKLNRHFSSGPLNTWNFNKILKSWTKLKILQKFVTSTVFNSLSYKQSWSWKLERIFFSFFPGKARTMLFQNCTNLLVWLSG